METSLFEKIFKDETTLEFYLDLASVYFPITKFRSLFVTIYNNLVSPNRCTVSCIAPSPPLAALVLPLAAGVLFHLSVAGGMAMSVSVFLSVIVSSVGDITGSSHTEKRAAEDG